jgi:hypothetical protein
LFDFPSGVVTLVTHGSAADSYVRPAMPRRDPERGQATVEWVGLVLGVALLLGAVSAGGREAAKGESADGLGEAVAERIVCAAKGACGAGTRGGRLGRVPAGRRPSRRPSPSAPSLSHAGFAEGVARRAWFLCLGYRRWQYDREHPRPPLEGVPLRETVKTVNECVNPLSFLFG